MDLNDLIKLAGIQNAQAPVQEQPVASSSDGMRTMIALVTPEQLNQLTGDAPVAEEMPGEATTEPNPQEYQGTLGSASDLSLRRYLGANGEHVTVDETKVYEDHTVEDITEAFAQYKAAQNQVVTEAHACGCDDSCACGGNCGPDCNCHSGCSATNESVEETVEEAVIDEDDVEENAFNQAAAAAARSNKPEFEFGGKKYKTKMSKDTAHKLDDDIDVLKQLAGL